jgi:NitT/TauT family transport system substrate-binding protein
MEGKFKPQLFLLADNGYPGYTNMVFVTQKWIDSNPRAVQAFVDATAEGWWNYVFANPAPANALIKAANPDMTDGLIAQAIAKMKSYGLVMGGDAAKSGLGAMSDATWKSFFDTMSSVGLYDKTLNYRKAYDLRFANAGLHLGVAKK